MRTRCPVCSTIFRVTSEQLRLKAGKVRCGHCQSVFNAFDEFLEDAPAPADVSIKSEVVALTEPPSEVFHASLNPTLPEPEFSAPVEEEPLATATSFPAEPTEETELAEPEIAEVVTEEVQPAQERLREALPEMPLSEIPVADEEQAELPAPRLETPEESTSAAREAGLVAARELNDAPGYNRWAAGTLTGSGLGAFEGDTQQRSVWPFVTVALLLLLVLLGQLLHHFRTDLVSRWPTAAALYELVAVDVPLPRNSDLVTIETSDLQSDNARGLFVLQASLHNRASYPQAWPALELTLTDTNDTVVSRRVLMDADYLPPAINSAAFPANGETAIKLWIEAKNIGAAGYRLYVFYP
ncbi:MAG: zinc-ribbon domain-containing protein [Azonexus sp.]|nr:zinc-ribbon domain-containing protein [Azonexus sp.]